MLIKYTLIALSFLSVVACQKAAMPSMVNSSKMMDRGFALEDECPIEEPVKELIAYGSQDRSVWERVISDVVEQPFRVQFLNNWEKGEKYTILDMRCIDGPEDKISFIIDFSSNALGELRLEADLTQDGIKGVSLAIWRYVQPEFYSTPGRVGTRLQRHML